MKSANKAVEIFAAGADLQLTDPQNDAIETQLRLDKLIEDLKEISGRVLVGSKTTLCHYQCWTVDFRDERRQHCYKIYHVCLWPSFI